MASDFRKGTLSDIIDFKNGKAVKKSNGSVPIYGGNGVLGYTSQPNFCNTLIVGRVGAYCGSVHIEPNDCWVSDNAIAGLPRKNTCNFYNYYLLKALRLNEQRIGSSQPLLTQGILNNIELSIEFDYHEQQKIAAVLSALDAKIELNNRINAELEAMAKTLYDYWFVQFDFPDENGKPYKSSGGKMVYNETLKREIPDGWKLEPLLNSCQVIDCLHSKKPSKVECGNNDYLLQLENILDNNLLDVTNKYHVSKEDYVKWTSRIEVRRYDIVMTNAGRIAAFAQVPKGVIAGIGRNITAIRPFAIPPNLFFVSLSCVDIQKQILSNLDHGAFFKSFNVKGIKVLQNLRAPKDIEQRLERKVTPMVEKRNLIMSENQELTQLRNWLLPMLMNGQVTVKP